LPRRKLPIRRLACAIVAIFVLAPVLQATELKDSLQIVTQTNRSEAASQQEVDRLSRESQTLLEEYRRLQNNAEYQAAYTLELQQLDAAQQARIQDLEREISDVASTRQRIVPLMRSMVDALEKFVVLDLPFHHEERITSVLRLKQRLQQPDLPLSAKFRMLLEAFQTEQDYGVTIEAWRGPLAVADETLSVEYLRIGRMALYYQTLDGRNSACWDRSTQTWMPLEQAYNQAITEAFRVANNQVAPRLLTLPMKPPGETP